MAAFLNELVVDKNSSYMLHEFVSDAYDELVKKDKAGWKDRIEAIDSLIGNTDVYFEEFDEGDMDIEE